MLEIMCHCDNKKNIKHMNVDIFFKVYCQNEIFLTKINCESFISIYIRVNSRFKV